MTQNEIMTEKLEKLVEQLTLKQLNELETMISLEKMVRRVRKFNKNR